MTVVAEYLEARREEDLARLRRTAALRAMIASGHTQREVAEALGVSQPAISQQLRSAPDLGAIDAVTVLRAVAPVVKALASERGFTELAVFGSVARGDADPDSDIDLLVTAPPGTSTFDLIKLRSVLEATVGRPIDLVERGGLTPGLDDDICRDAVML